ncbi:MAG: ABC transporter substrate-binding protein [Brevibacterium sp.]
MPSVPSRTTHAPSPFGLRRGLIAVSAACLLALTGCGGGSEAQESGSGEAAGGSVEGAFGSTRITKAKRVVALSVSDADAALAAGVVPVAMTEAPVEPVMPWAKEAVKDLGGDDPELFEWSTEDTIPFEDIAAWEPDMILASGAVIGKDTYDQLTEIAPTLTSAEEGKADGWRSQEERVSTVIDRKDAGDEAIETAQTAVDDAAEAHPELKGNSFLVALFHSPDEVGVLSDEDSATVQFFSEIGLELDPVAEKMTAGDVPDRLSLEKLDVLESDVIVGYFPEAYLREQYDKVPTFTSLPAVENDHFYQPTDEEWRGLRSVSALALPELASPIAEKLDTAVNG